MRIRNVLFVALCGMLAACGDHGHGHEQELISRVTLTFAPPAGNTVRAAFDDPDGDGGMAPTIDPIVLAAGVTYDVSVSFQNALEDPPEEITDEVRDEGDEHQVFFLGSAVSGPATTSGSAPLLHAYADMDRNGNPLGLASTVMTSAGSGELTVVLLHLPPVNEVAVKTADTAARVRDEGVAAVGEIDARVTFPVTVQ